MKRNHKKAEEKTSPLRWRRNHQKRHKWNACMHTIRHEYSVVESLYTQGWDVKFLVWISVTSLLIPTTLSLLNAHGWSFLQPVKSMRQKLDYYNLYQLLCLKLSLTHILQCTWEMSTPVSFSTAVGSLVMISSTSPASLAAPTSEPPLDTIVTFWASDSGLLISSAICRTRQNTGVNTLTCIFFSLCIKKSVWKCQKLKKNILKYHKNIFKLGWGRKIFCINKSKMWQYNRNWLKNQLN